jgi:hypothetical protein
MNLWSDNDETHVLTKRHKGGPACRIVIRQPDRQRPVGVGAAGRQAWGKAQPDGKRAKGGEGGRECVAFPR